MSVELKELDPCRKNNQRLSLESRTFPFDVVIPLQTLSSSSSSFQSLSSSSSLLSLLLLLLLRMLQGQVFVRFRLERVKWLNSAAHAVRPPVRETAGSAEIVLGLFIKRTAD